MKSFIFAVCLLLTVGLFVTVNAFHTVYRIDILLEIANQLPKTEAEFENAADIDEAVFSLISRWDKEIPFIVCTAGSGNINRCDEAIGALAVHFQNQSGAEFAVALSEFCDGLKRLRILEGIHPEGIF